MPRAYNHALCKKCQSRFLQAHCDGMCRRCFTGMAPRVAPRPGETYRRERARHLAKQAATEAELAKLRIVNEGPRPSRVITVGHRVYEVVWDGA